MQNSLAYFWGVMILIVLLLAFGGLLVSLLAMWLGGMLTGG